MYKNSVAGAQSVRIKSVQNPIIRNAMRRNLDEIPQILSCIAGPKFQRVFEDTANQQQEDQRNNRIETCSEPRAVSNRLAKKVTQIASDIGVSIVTLPTRNAFNAGR